MSIKNSGEEKKKSIREDIRNNILEPDSYEKLIETAIEYSRIRTSLKDYAIVLNDIIQVDLRGNIGLIIKNGLNKNVKLENIFVWELSNDGNLYKGRIFDKVIYFSFDDILNYIVKYKNKKIYDINKRDIVDGFLDIFNYFILNIDKEKFNIIDSIIDKSKIETYYGYDNKNNRFVKNNSSPEHNATDIIEEFGKVYKIILDLKEETGKKLDRFKNDFKEQEKIIDKFSEEVVSILSEINNNNNNIGEVEKRIVNEKIIPKDIWDKLEKDSQRLVVTSDIIYENLKEKNDYYIDFTPICITISKVVEIEIYEKIIKKLQGYLKESKTNIRYWPKILVYNDKKNNRYMENKQVTLGNFAHDIKKDIRFREILVKNSNRLLENVEGEKIEITYWEKIASDCDYITKTYRNPAAHRDVIKKDVADECRDYVIYAKKFLVEFMKRLK